MSGFLFYSACIGFGLGIFARSVFTYGVAEITAVLVVCLALSVLWRRKTDAFSAPVLLSAAIFLLTFSIASLRLEYALWQMPPTTLSSQVDTLVSLEGEVVREPDQREHATNLTVKVDDVRILVSTDVYSTIKYGDRLLVEGTLRTPEAFETELGRTFDYKGYLQAKGIAYTMSFAKVTVLDQGGGNPVIATLFQVKHFFVEALEQVIPHPQVALGEGLLLGIKQGLGETLEEVFRTAGIMHIVVLSGYNMMIVVMFVSYFLAFSFSQRTQLIFGAVAICLFAVMVGLGASVVRASAMALLSVLAKATGRTYAVLRALCATGVVMLAINPYLLVYDVGFQFSFVATFGLIFVAPLIEPYVTFVPTSFNIRDFLTATLAVQIFLTPLLLYQIGEFSVVAVFVNILVLPLVAPAMLLTFLSGVAAFLHVSLGVFFGYGAHLVLEAIIRIATFFASLPLASFAVPQFHFFFVVVCYALLGVFLWRLTLRQGQAALGEDTLASWTIVDEATLKTKVAVVQSTPATSVSKETPIFFR